MAYNFLSANSRYLSVDSSPITGVPITLSAFIKASSTANQNILSVGNFSSTHRNVISTDTSNNISITSIGSTTFGTAISLTAFSNEVWNHSAGVFYSASSRQAYLNGVGGILNGTNIGTQNTANKISIGTRFANSAAGVYFSGDIAEVGIWNAALTAAEIASLAKGITCDKVRPQNLVFYAPLIRNLQDTKGGLIITPNNNPTIATHPRIYK